MRLKKRLEHKVPFPEPLRQEADRRPFLAIIAIVILVSFIGLLNHLEKEAITGSAVQTISFVKEGKELNFEVKTGGIQSATIHLAQDTKNAKIVFEEQEAVYPKIKEPIYSFVKVSSDKAIPFSTLDLKLKLKEQDLLDKSIAQNEVQLYVDGKPVATTFVNAEKGYLFYTTKVTSFGDYVIGKKQKEQPKPMAANQVTTKTSITSSESASKKEEKLENEQEEPSAAEETLTGEENDEENIAGSAVASDEQKQETSTTPFWEKISSFFKGLFG